MEATPGNEIALKERLESTNWSWDILRMAWSVIQMVFKD
jgi:hypothetical protein